MVPGLECPRHRALFKIFLNLWTSYPGGRLWALWLLFNIYVQCLNQELWYHKQTALIWTGHRNFPSILTIEKYVYKVSLSNILRTEYRARKILAWTVRKEFPSIRIACLLGLETINTKGRINPVSEAFGIDKIAIKFQFAICKRANVPYFTTESPEKSPCIYFGIWV